ncbi:PIN domain-containing protein [Thermococcus sp.]|uniref:PIN domain-containing protein n=1 Tax=Thermococcus sp. TaxID=35749 RepID=UPI0025CEEEC4|nr:PIN domain-containing protein [Thermococcus sp.]
MSRGKIKTILDTSILISALKSRFPSLSSAWFCLNCLKGRFLENYVSDDIIEEMKFTLAIVAMEAASKKNWKGVLALADEIMRIVLLGSKKIKPRVDFSQESHIVKTIKDESDIKFLNVLYSAKVKFLLTQNTKHFGNFVVSGDKTGKAKVRQHYFYVMRAGQFRTYMKNAHPSIAEKCKKGKT